MGNNVIDMNTQLPAELASLFDASSLEDDLTAGVESGFAVVSYRGSKWRIKYKGEEELIKNADNEPAPSIEVVLLKANKNISKIYYEKQYTEGDDASPDCFSADGIKPDASVQDPPAKSCAACEYNQWGSRITEQGKKAKACSDNRRVAVILASDIKNKLYGGPMLLRIPATSLPELATYGKKVASKGVGYNALVTKISFDTDVSYPKMKFLPSRMIDKEEASAIFEMFKEGGVDNILDTVTELAESTEATPAEETKQEVKEKPKKDTKKTAEKAAEETSAAPEPDKPAEASDTSDLDAELDDILGDLEGLH